MATAAITDLRRTDIRRNTLANPFWITSGLITPSDDDKAALLFSFPITANAYAPAYKPFWIEQMIFEVVAVFDGTSSINVGLCTLADNTITTADTGTVVDEDEYFLSDDITEATIGYYTPGGIGTDPNWLTLKILGAGVTPYYLTPADTTVPAIYASLTGGTITVGSARLHMCINEVP